MQIDWDEDEWNENLLVSSLDNVEEVFWNDLCQQYQDILQNQGHTRETWDKGIHKAAGAHCQVAAWNELSVESSRQYQADGWTAESWNARRWIYSRKNAEEILWTDLCSPYRQELQACGWNEVAWNQDDVSKMTFYNEAELDWDELPEGRRRHFTNNGVDRDEYQLEYRNTEDGSHSDMLAPGGKFSPRVISLSVPQVQALDLAHLTSLDVDIGLRHNKADEENESFVATAPLCEYVARIREGDSSTYSQIEDDRYTEELWHPIGSKVIQHLSYALSKSELVETGEYRKEWMDESKLTWGMFLGANATTTALHFDTDAFNFLYVVEGRKRVVMLENTGLVNETRFNVSSFFSGSAWADLNVLKAENQPPHTVVLEVGPGEGVAIPHRAWHSVENLEPTVAYAVRVTYQ